MWLSLVELFRRISSKAYKMVSSICSCLLLLSITNALGFACCSWFERTKSKAD